MPAVTKDSVFVQTKEQVSCDLDGEAVILNHRKGVYYGLDPVGARVWDRLQKPASVDQIKEMILNEYHVDPRRCERDLLKILRELRAEGLIETKG